MPRPDWEKYGVYSMAQYTSQKGALVVRPRTIVPCEWTDTFNSLLCKLGVEDEIIERTIISNNDKFLDPTHIVPLTAPLSLCDQFKYNFVCFCLESQQQPARCTSDVTALVPSGPSQIPNVY